jgi:hypothetical protein
MPKPTIVAVLLPLLPLVTACESSSTESGYTPTTDVSDLCVTPLAPDEPLCSTAFGDGTWPASHRGSYAQGSSAFSGPSDGENTTSEHIDLPAAGVPIVPVFTEPYEDGGRAIWSTVTGLEAAIVKLDHQRFEIIDWYVPADREDDPPTFSLGVSGAYTAVDARGRFIAGRTRFVGFYRDSTAGDRSSPIELEKRVFLPDELFCNEDDVIAGMTLTYDGNLAFATELGNLFVISPDVDPDAIDATAASANPGCPTTDPAGLEIVSNSLAADESGGIYLLTSAAMYRFDWNGEDLSKTWRAEYEVDEDVPSPIRLGPGSGSTPSLMGTDADDDRFVVITDGQELMRLVLFWRDEVPADWEPIGPGKDPRIACELAVDFGTGTTTAISEQSVAVRGYSAIVVNDLLTDPTINPPSGLPFDAVAQNLVSALEGGIPEKAPFGLERIDWDPATRTCETIWENAEVSIPNSIPSISEATGLIYGTGQRDGQWGLEGLDFESGDSRVWVPAGDGVCPGDGGGVAGALPGVPEVLEVVPDSCENSVYAATTVGPDGMVYQGTLAGYTRYVPASADAIPDESRIESGVSQGLDLLDRAESGVADQIGTRAYLRRAMVQLEATRTVAIESGDSAAVGATEAALESLDAAVAAFDGGGDYDAQIEAARDALSDL